MKEYCIKKITYFFFIKGNFMSDIGLIRLTLILLYFTFFLFSGKTVAQNISNAEGVNRVATSNGFSQPVNLANDYRVLNYRKVSTTASNPTDGTGQQVKTVNVQNAGGNVTPNNMTGLDGFLFTSGHSVTQFANKWGFTTTTQAALDAVNTATFNGVNNRAIDMSTVGNHTFELKNNYQYCNFENKSEKTFEAFFFQL